MSKLEANLKIKIVFDDGSEHDVSDYYFDALQPHESTLSHPGVVVRKVPLKVYQGYKYTPKLLDDDHDCPECKFYHAQHHS